MEAFVIGTGIISPQNTSNGKIFPVVPADYQANHITCIEPDYSQWINPQQLRRMSRILKMGTSAAVMALNDAALQKPDAIVTGTGYGCLEDTGIFLTKISELREEGLNPTPFMQSTHNTIGSQVALLLKCYGYNQTYAHGPFSFEQALLDTMLLLEENPDQHILTGGVDELTTTGHAIQSRFNKYRNNSANTLSLFSVPAHGTIAGEGAAYFVITGKHNGKAKASIRAVKTFNCEEKSQAEENVREFLRQNNLAPNEVDLILSGKSGDVAADQQIDKTLTAIFQNSSIGAFKHLCGEHCVASSFALWLGAMILERQEIPEIVIQKNAHRPVRTILIYNVYFHSHHALILLRSCLPIKN
ncbi:MAG: beta-ketoacyl synthase chain length factor [Cyclobacteriaceae bacterium]|nr:beta-ketoacyl synthase chain length factor [Cyclobacteriaceae bacterium]